MTSKTCVPKASTSRLAKWPPMPLMRPDPRYFSMPATVVGATDLREVAVNCRPWTRSCVQLPSACTNSPSETAAAWPTRVTRSRRPRTSTRSTQNPFSSLWNVMRSTVPARCSIDDGGGSRRRGWRTEVLYIVVLEVLEVQCWRCRGCWGAVPEVLGAGCRGVTPGHFLLLRRPGAPDASASVSVRRSYGLFVALRAAALMPRFSRKHATGPWYLAPRRSAICRPTSSSWGPERIRAAAGKTSRSSTRMCAS